MTEIPDTDEELLGQCDVHTFRSSGKGGQSVNTTDSAVRLVHRPTGVVVVCRTERSQHRNKRTCLRRLRQRLEALNEVQAPRVPTRPSVGAKRRRLASKSHVAAKKRLRSRRVEDD